MNEKESYLRDHKMPDNMGFKSDPTTDECIARLGGTRDHKKAISGNSCMVNNTNGKVRVPDSVDYSNPAGNGFGNTFADGSINTALSGSRKEY